MLYLLSYLALKIIYKWQLWKDFNPHLRVLGSPVFTIKLHSYDGEEENRTLSPGFPERPASDRLRLSQSPSLRQKLVGRGGL